MAVQVVFGMTQSGKSFFTENFLIKGKQRVIIFDKACCFHGKGEVFTNPDERKILQIFRENAAAGSFYLVFRPDRNTNLETLFNRVSELACALGRVAKKNGDWVDFVIDEADFVCSERHQSKQLKHLVNVGRHDHVDSIFITRNPNRIHTDIRVNASKMACFRIPNARSITFFLQNFTPKTVEKIANLPKYWRLDWDETGTERIFDEKQKLQWELLPNLELFKNEKAKGKARKNERNF